MRALVIVVAVALFAGCSSQPPPITPDAIDEQGPILLDDGRPDPIPRSIRRLLAEERTKMEDIHSLVAVVGDSRGRARAAAQADVLAEELARIQARIEATNGESDRLDETFESLRNLSSRIAVFHESLRLATM
jgi:hypothetical protein